jgi:hypothetical protein
MDAACLVLDFERLAGSGIRRAVLCVLHVSILLIDGQADAHSREGAQVKTDSMEEAARIISKAFGLCMTDRISPPDQSRKWGVYYVVGLVLKCYFRVCGAVYLLSPSQSHMFPLTGQTNISVEEYPSCS